MKRDQHLKHVKKKDSSNKTQLHKETCLQQFINNFKKAKGRAGEFYSSYPGQRQSITFFQVSNFRGVFCDDYRMTGVGGVNLIQTFVPVIRSPDLCL